MRVKIVMSFLPLSPVAIGSIILALSVATGHATPAPAVGSTVPASTNLSKITVTGSRIPQTSVATAQPVVRINRKEINASGFHSVGQLLQNLSAAGPSVNMSFNNTNNGESTINLHDLGAKRVLVLVNGQRWVSQLDNVVDLTSIPLAAVDHIEILLDGASSIYGSEAIAGVINIITVKNFNGVEANAYLGIYDASKDGGGWDGRTQKYSVTAGMTGAESSLLFSMGYYNAEPVFAGNRKTSSEPLFGYGVQNGFPPAGGRFVVLNLTGSSQLPNGCNPGSVVCDVAGPNDYDPSGFHAYTANDNYNQAPDEYLLTPSERWYVYSQGRYDLTDDINAHYTMTYRQRNSSRRLFPFPMLLGVQGSARQNGMRIGVAKDAPGNPFGVDLVPYFPGTGGFETWCSEFGSPTCMSQFNVAMVLIRAPKDLGIFTISNDVKTYYLNGGLTGFFNFAGNQWHWNADYIYSQQDIIETTSGLWDTSRFQKALSHGCSTDANCVPIDIFGDISPDARDYVEKGANGISEFKVIMRDYNASVAGNFFNSWYAGPWGVAAGYEYEKLEGTHSPGPLALQGNLPTGQKEPTAGSIRTNAEYFELRVPLAKDAFLARSLSLNLAQRYSQFHWEGVGNLFDPSTSSISTTGVSEASHSVTPRVTMKWTPIRDLVMRATWAQGFRAPSLAELFGGVNGANYIGLTDPCALDPSTTPRSDLPPGCNGNFHVEPTSGLVQNSTGGNSALSPEKSITRTLGFVVSPSVLPRFDASVDYYKTEVTGVIRAPSAQYFMDNCYVGDNPESCAHIVTAGSGDNTTVTQVITLNQNEGSLKVEGIDVNFQYKFPTTSIGTFTASLSGNFARSVVFCKINGICQDVAGTAGPTETGVGGKAYPKHKYNFALNWAYGPWSLNYNATLIGPMWEDCTLSLANGEGKTADDTAAGRFNNGFCSNVMALASDGSIDRGLNHIGTTVYQDVQANYTIQDWSTTFTFGVQNIFDKTAPIAMSGGAFNFYPSVYRIPGRFIYGRVSVRF